MDIFSGEMMTLPMMSGTVVDMGFGRFSTSSDTYQPNGRNNYRAPVYHKLDVGMKCGRYDELSFGVYNVISKTAELELLKTDE